MRAILSVSFAVALLASLFHTGLGQGKKSSKPPKAQPEPLTLDEPLEVISPRKLSEAEQDRREAQILFAAARKKQRLEEREEALRLYQRAHRRDPGRGAVLLEIVNLGLLLRRDSVLENYGLAAAEANPKNPAILAEANPDNPGIIEVMAGYLRRQGSFDAATKLYEKLIAIQPEKAKKTPDYVDLAMMSGRLHFVQGKFHQAADRFALVLTAIDNPDDFGLRDRQIKVLLGGDEARTYVWFYESFLQAGRLKEAQRVFKKAYEAGDKADVAYQRARLHVAAGRFAEAEKELKAYFDTGSDSQAAAPFGLIAEMYEKQKKAAALLGDLEKRLEARRADGKEDVYLAAFLAEEYRKTDKFDKAEPLWRDIIKAGEGKPDYRAAVTAAHLSLAQGYLKAKNAEKLFEELAWLAERSPTGTLTVLGSEEIESLRKDKPLLAAVVKAAQRRRAKLDYGGHLAAGLLALDAKQYKLAGEFFEAAAGAKKDAAAQTVLTWGLSLLDARQYDEAARVFRLGIDDKLLGEDNASFHDWLAMSLAFADKTDEALKVAREAADIGKDDPRVQSRLAWVYYQSKQYDKAREGYEEFVEKYEKTARELEAKGDDSGRSGAIRSQLRRVRLVLSNIAVFQNDLPTAEEWIEQVLDENPGDVTALNDLGYLWSDQGKHLQRSLRMIRRAVAAEPDNGAYLDSLGWALYRLGNYEAAVVELKKAVDSEEDPDSVILNHLGDAYHKANQPDKARETWERALKGFDEKRDADKIKETRAKIREVSGE